MGLSDSGMHIANIGLNTMDDLRMKAAMHAAQI
jgi:hypothetical protein